MKTEEDEAFDELARKQGDWGGGFQAKRQMAADKLQEPIYKITVFDNAYPKGIPLEDWVQPPQPAQEPVAIVHIKDGCLVGSHRDESKPFPNGQYGLWPITTPAQPAQKTDILTIAYQSGFYDGRKAALAGREWNFCERCGKRTADKTAIHTCTPPQEGT